MKHQYTESNIIKRFFKRALDDDVGSRNIAVNAMRLGIPLHWGGMADPFPPEEKEIKISYEISKILKDYDYSVVISTKGRGLLINKYLKQFSDLKALWQFSIISTNENNLLRLEPNAATLTERLEQIVMLRKMDIPVVIRLQPLIYSYLDIDKFINLLLDIDVKYVSIEHLKLPMDNPKAIRKLSSDLGYDIVKKYREYSGAITPPKLYGREMELSGETKYRLVKDIYHEFRKNGIKVGAADNQLHHLNDGESCCGVDTFTNWKTYKANYTSMFKRKKDDFHFEDLIGDINSIPKGLVNINSDSRPKDNSTCDIIGLLRWKWNNPRLADSPADTIRLKPHIENDEIVYKWEKSEQSQLI